MSNAGTKIRLVIFDFGDTLFHAVADNRSRGSGRWEVLERDGAGRPTAVAPPDRPGMAEATFENVQAVLHELRRRGTWLGVASSADPAYTPYMVEAFEMGALFRHAFMAPGDINGNCSRKGDWVEAIIHAFNIAECQDVPLQANEVMFVDDLLRCLEAVRRKVPGIHAIMSTPRMPGGLDYIPEVIAEIEAGDR